MKYLLALVALLAAVDEVSTAAPTPWSSAAHLEPLGVVRVTRYTHHDDPQFGRWTASGYILKDSDEGKVCAVSRDWFRTRVKVNDVVWIEGFQRPCVVKDTMGLRNRKGFLQTKWFDVYITDVKRGLAFGIQKRRAYIVR